MRALAAAMALATLSATGVQAQALTSGQQNYKRCPVQAMEEGVRIVEQFCGSLKNAPAIPSYDEAWGSITLKELEAHRTTMQSYESQIDAYTQCINTRVMGDGSLPTETLDYAACAHQAAGEQVVKVNENWGMACLAFEDTNGESYSGSCFPGSG